MLIIVLVLLFNTPADSDQNYSNDTDDDNLTYNKSQYNTFAKALFAAVDGWGTEEAVVYRILEKLKNKDDWNYLVTVYGTDTDDFTLPDRLIYELDNSEQKKVNSILNPLGVYL